MVLELKNYSINIRIQDKGCMEVEGQQIEMPTQDEQLKFKHHVKKLRCPFVAFADFERLTEELKKPEGDEIKTLQLSGT